jgi:signal transduction histidine kinase
LGETPVELTTASHVDRVMATRLPLLLGLTLRAQRDCVYRVIQESLINVLKHAGPASATVSLPYQPDQLIAQVTDNDRRVQTADPAGSGHGLLGIAERARLYGGTLDAGPRPEGGFTVTITLPLPQAR